VEAITLVSLNEAPLEVAIWAKLEHIEPWQRSIRYPVTATLSVDAVQERLICVLDIAVAVKLVGAVGGVVSRGAAAEPTLLQPEDPIESRRPITAESGVVQATACRRKPTALRHTSDRDDAAENKKRLEIGKLPWSPGSKKNGSQMKYSSVPEYGNERGDAMPKNYLDSQQADNGQRRTTRSLRRK